MIGLKKMSAWPFLIFALLFAMLVCLHFYLAYRAWQGSREEQGFDIDPEYVRMEDYFARSFRLKVAEWLKLPPLSLAPDGARVIRKGRELIQVSGRADYPPRSRSDDILVVQGPFRCQAGCIFNREIYAQQDASIGAGTRLQSIAADGNLMLDSKVHVARWADCTGIMVLAPGAVVTARATAGKSIYLDPGSQAGSFFAPTVSTSRQAPASPVPPRLPDGPKLEIPAPPDTHAASYFGGEIDSSRLYRLNPDCWLYDGDLKPLSPVRMRVSMIVKGDCDLTAGSVIEGDLKAKGCIFLAEGVICRGNVIAGKDIRFGPSSRFHGVVHAGKTMRLSRGVHGGDEGSRVAAFAAEVLTVEEDVVIHGKLASAERVIAAEEAAQ
jgi:hypothetical protein